MDAVFFQQRFQLLDCMGSPLVVAGDVIGRGHAGQAAGYRGDHGKLALFVQNIAHDGDEIRVQVFDVLDELLVSRAKLLRVQVGDENDAVARELIRSRSDLNFFAAQPVLLPPEPPRQGGNHQHESQKSGQTAGPAPPTPPPGSLRRGADPLLPVSVFNHGRYRRASSGSSARWSLSAG